MITVQGAGLGSGCVIKIQKRQIGDRVKELSKEVYVNDARGIVHVMQKYLPAGTMLEVAELWKELKYKPALVGFKEACDENSR